ncbi:MAG: hypothetical protein SFU21_15165 [Flavihumibacter sp.]|nr:hypothetical protein [Flavihumibacter sp.]
MNILQLQKNVGVLKNTLVPEVQKIVLNNGEAYTDAIATQLYKGQDRFKKPLRPSYLEDVGPDKFLKTRGQAIAYSYYKQRITPNPERGLFTPNLFLNGYFYSSMRIELKREGLGIIYITTDTIFGTDLFKKYGIPAFQLQDENRYSFIDNRLRPPLKKFIINTLTQQ